VNLRRLPFCFAALRVAVVLVTTLWNPCLLAQPEPASEAVPVWIYNADSFEFWHTPQGEARGFYSQLVDALNQRYGLNLQLRPISGNEIGQRFAADAHGVYVGVLRTEQRARTKLLSSRLFDNEVVAASQTMQVSTPEQLRNTRVLFRENDATLDSVKQRYPDLTFRTQREVSSSEEAFRLLSQGKADFYINDASEMENTPRYYVISRPFPELRIPVVMAFSPDLRPMREQVNAFIGEWFRSGKMRRALEESKRDYFLSRITLSEAERSWLQQNRLQVWLPKNENYAPVIWKEGQGYRGIAINMINDMRDLLGMRVDVQFVENYAAILQQQRWPVRLLNITERNGNTPPGQIGPSLPWHNAYYNLIGHPFLWNEESIRNQRVGVLKGSFAETYLQRRFGDDVAIVSLASVDRLIDAIENKKIDFILGDLSTLESALRGNELFRGVLKVAGVTRSEFEIGPWVAPDHPLHNLLSQVQRLSSFRTQLERTEEQPVAEFPILTSGESYLPLPVGSAILILFVLERLLFGSQENRPVVLIGNHS
jgi:ABC-type amino acid transport substrate-binding protein